MDIAEDPPTGLTAGVDYEMTVSQPALSQQPDDRMDEEAVAAADDHSMAVEDFEMQQQYAAEAQTGADGDIEFVEEEGGAAPTSVERVALREATMVTDSQAVHSHTVDTAVPFSDEIYNTGLSVPEGPLPVLTDVPEARDPVEASTEPAVVDRSESSVQEATNEASASEQPSKDVSVGSSAAGVKPPVTDVPVITERDAHEPDELASTPHDGAQQAADVVAQDRQGLEESHSRAVPEGDDTAEQEGAEDDQLDHSVDSDDGSSPPTVRVSFNGQDFVLFSHDEPSSYTGAATRDSTADDEEATATALVAAPRLKVADDAFWQPLESVFASLRVKECLGEFLEEATELVMHMPDLDLTVQEDNVYCREITLDDLFQLHQGLGFTTSLHVLVTETQRFISKYNALAQHVARLIEQAQNEDDGGYDEAEHAADGAGAVPPPGGPEEQLQRSAEHGARVHGIAEGQDENDELDAGDEDPQAAARAVEGIVSAQNAQAEDDSHEAAAVDTPNIADVAQGHAEEDGAVGQVGAMAGLSEPTTDRVEPEPVVGDAAEDEHEEADHEGDQTYVTVNEAGEEDEIDEIDEGDADERHAPADNGEEHKAAEQAEEWDEEEDYEEEDGEEEGDAAEDDAAEAVGEGDEGEVDEVGDEYAGGDDGADGEEAEDVDGDNAEGEEGIYEEEEGEEGAESSVTLEGSDDAAEELDDDAAAAEDESGDDEIIEYEDPEEGNDGEGDYAEVADGQAGADDGIYDEQGEAADLVSSTGKRALDDSAENDEPSNGDLKRAKVDQQI